MLRPSADLTARCLGVAAMVALSACAVGPDYARPEVPVSPAFRELSGPFQGSPELGANWWTVFRDPELDRLQAAAMRANQDIKAAFARVGQARALSDGARSGFWPSLTANPSVRRGRSSGTTGGVARTETSYALPLDLEYELDVWGRVRRLSESADASTKLSATEFAVAMQAVQADVAQHYFNLRGLDAQAAMLARSLELYRRQAELVGQESQAGLAPKSDLLQARTLIESALVQQAEVHRQRANTEHALAVLIGLAPSEFSLSPRPSGSTVTVVPVVPAGLPSELLGRRPDVAAAEQRLIAANADVGEARANYYPRLTLTGSAGFSTINSAQVVDWQSRVWSLGPTLSLPLFQGGRLDAAFAGARRRQEEALANYRTAILTAFRETEDVLSDLANRTAAAEAQARLVEAARETVRLVEIRRRAGLAPYYELMDAQRTLLAAELGIAQLDNLRLNSTVQLIKAIGGGWKPETEPKVAE